MTLSDDLATLRTAISGYSGTPLRWPGRGDALAALDRVESLVREADAEIARLNKRLAEGWDEVVAKDKARAIKAEIRAEADGASEKRLRDGLATILHRAETRRTAVRMDGSEQWAVPLAGEVAEIARALLAEDGAA